MAESDEFKRGLDIAMNFIAYRMRSEREVVRRLKKAQIPEDILGSILNRLRELLLLDDRAFASAYTRDQMIGHKRGPVRVRQGLASLGVEKDIVEDALDEVLEVHDPFEQALDLASRRWELLSRRHDAAAARQKLYQYLVRRGFTFEDARRATQRIWEQDENG